jgi:hypothetical protein
MNDVCPSEIVDAVTALLQEAVYRAQVALSPRWLPPSYQPPWACRPDQSVTPGNDALFWQQRLFVWIMQPPQWEHHDPVYLLVVHNEVARYLISTNTLPQNDARAVATKQLVQKALETEAPGNFTRHYHLLTNGLLVEQVHQTSLQTCYYYATYVDRPTLDQPNPSPPSQAEER